MPSNKFIPTKKNMVKIAIRTLELALAAVKYFLQKSSIIHVWQCPKSASVQVQSLKTGLTFKFAE